MKLNIGNRLIALIMLIAVLMSMFVFFFTFSLIGIIKGEIREAIIEVSGMMVEGVDLLADCLHHLKTGEDVGYI